MGVVDEAVLGLNRNWTPAGVYTVGTSVTMVLREMAFCLDPETYVLHDYESWVQANPKNMRMIKTSSGYIPAPEILVLKAYSKTPPSGLSFNRTNLYHRDQFTCQYCLKRLNGGQLTIDHVLPSSRGGRTSWTNCVTCCSPCNTRKADKTPKEARMFLRDKPTKPKDPVGFRVPRSKRRESWEQFLVKTKG